MLKIHLRWLFSGHSFKTALLAPGRDPSAEGPALPPTQAREPPPVSPVCLPLSSRHGGDGQVPQQEEPGSAAALSSSPVPRPPPPGLSTPGPGRRAGGRHLSCLSIWGRGPACQHHLDRGGRAAVWHPLAGGAGADPHLSSPRDAPTLKSDLGQGSPSNLVFLVAIQAKGWGK